MNHVWRSLGERTETGQGTLSSVCEWGRKLVWISDWAAFTYSPTPLASQSVEKVRQSPAELQLPLQFNLDETWNFHFSGAGHLNTEYKDVFFSSLSTRLWPWHRDKVLFLKNKIWTLLRLFLHKHLWGRALKLSFPTKLTTNFRKLFASHSFFFLFWSKPKWCPLQDAEQAHVI